MPFFGRTVASLWCLVIFEVCRVWSTTLKGEEKCNPNIVIFDQCKTNETCVSNHDSSGLCQCKTDFFRSDNGLCQPVPQGLNPSNLPDNSKTTDSIEFEFKYILWLIIPVMIIGVISAVIFTGRKKNWLNRLYSMRMRSYNNDLVSSPDDDDPPIA